jgi:hypothetical protein
MLYKIEQYTFDAVKENAINILPCVVDIVVVAVVVSDLIKVAARAPAIAALKRRAVIKKTSTHLHRRIRAPARLFEIIFR